MWRSRYTWSLTRMRNFDSGIINGTCNLWEITTLQIRNRTRHATCSTVSSRRFPTRRRYHPAKTPFLPEGSFIPRQSCTITILRYQVVTNKGNAVHYKTGSSLCIFPVSGKTPPLDRQGNIPHRNRLQTGRSRFADMASIAI